MIEQPDYIAAVNEISHEKLPPMPKNQFMFQHTFCPKPKIGLEDAKIFQET